MSKANDAIAAAIRADHPHLDYTSEDLLRRAVERAHRGHGLATRRGHVMDAIGVGAGVADTICAACGLDSDEEVGEEDDFDDYGEE